MKYKRFKSIIEQLTASSTAPDLCRMISYYIVGTQKNTRMCCVFDLIENLTDLNLGFKISQKNVQDNQSAAVLYFISEDDAKKFMTNNSLSGTIKRRTADTFNKYLRIDNDYEVPCYLAENYLLWFLRSKPNFQKYAQPRLSEKQLERINQFKENTLQSKDIIPDLPKAAQNQKISDKIEKEKALQERAQKVCIDYLPQFLPQLNEFLERFPTKSGISKITDPLQLFNDRSIYKSYSDKKINDDEYITEIYFSFDCFGKDLVRRMKNAIKSQNINFQKNRDVFTVNIYLNSKGSKIKGNDRSESKFGLISNFGLSIYYNFSFNLNEPDNDKYHGFPNNQYSDDLIENAIKIHLPKRYEGNKKSFSAPTVSLSPDRHVGLVRCGTYISICPPEVKNYSVLATADIRLIDIPNIKECGAINYEASLSMDVSDLKTSLANFDSVIVPAIINDFNSIRSFRDDMLSGERIKLKEII